MNPVKLTPLRLLHYLSLVRILQVISRASQAILLTLPRCRLAAHPEPCYYQKTNAAVFTGLKDDIFVHLKILLLARRVLSWRPAI